jgi:hypothetical protein
MDDSRKYIVGADFLLQNSNASLKYLSVSSSDRRSKNSGLAVTMVSMNLTVSFRILHFGFSFCAFSMRRWISL